MEPWPLFGRRTVGTDLPEDARDLIARAEKLVYLFPEHFDPQHLVAAQLDGGERPPMDLDAIIAEDGPAGRVHVFLGRHGAAPFAIQVRSRTATIHADPFHVRRDLLLLIKDHAESARTGETPAARSGSFVEDAA